MPILNNDEKLEKAVDNLIRYQEKLTNIAKNKIAKGDENSAISIIRDLRNVFFRIYGSKESNYDKYEALLFNPRYRERESVLNSLDSEKHDFSEPSVLFINIYLNSFYELWVEAYKYEKTETTSHIVDSIAGILERISVENGNNKLISYFLLALFRISKYGIKNPASIENNTLTKASYRWYFDIVFKPPYAKGGDFIYTEYLSVFDNWLWNSLKLLVANNCLWIYKEFISTIFHGNLLHGTSSSITSRILSPYFQDQGVSSNLIHGFIELEGSINNVSTFKQLSGFLERLEGLAKELEKSKSSDLASELYTDLSFKVQKYFLFNNVRIFQYFIGAFALFKQRYKFISELWGYPQPRDASATWGGNSILPNHLLDVLYLYFYRDSYIQKVELNWEDHHGARYYYENYILLLIARLFTIPISYIDFKPIDITPVLSFFKQQDRDLLIRSIETLQGRIDILRNEEALRALDLNVQVLVDDLENRISISDAVKNLLDKLTEGLKQLPPD